MILTHKQLLRKLEIQNGQADLVDAFRIVALYTELYGVKYYEKLSIEEELILMYEKLKEYKWSKKSIDYDINKDSKVCRRGNEEKLLREFYKKTDAKDGRNNTCAKCSVELNQAWKKKRDLKNEQIKN